MKHTVLAVVAFVLVAAGSASAHHGYANYVTDHPIYIEGDIQQILFRNPHVVMLIRTADGTDYAASWQGATWVGQIGVTKDTFKIGDHVIVLGAPNRNSEIHEVASLKEVRRPSDGWAWRANY